MIYIAYLLYSFFIFKFVDARSTLSYVVCAALVALPWIVIIVAASTIKVIFFQFLFIANI